jgi:hypothetical protein
MLGIACGSSDQFGREVESVSGVRAGGDIGRRVDRGNVLLGERLHVVVDRWHGEDDSRHLSTGGGDIRADGASLGDLENAEILAASSLSSCHGVGGTGRKACNSSYSRGRGLRGCLGLHEERLKRGVDTFEARDDFGGGFLQESETFAL